MLIFPTELNSGENLLGFYYLSRVKIEFLLRPHTVGPMGERREAQKWAGSPRLYSAVEDAQRKGGRYWTGQVDAT